ncbi:MAG: N-acetyltransferase [Rhodospirillaceae bacterium]
MTSPSPVIRLEMDADRAAIHALHSAAFETTAEADLVDLLRADNALTLSLVADIAGKLVGHVAVSPVTLNDSRDSKWFGLGPIAVHPNHQRRGIGATLMLKALNDTAALGGQGMVLLGDPAFYTRFGFQPSTDFDLAWENGGGPYFQAVKLGKATVPKGTVAYHPAFDQV